MTAREEWRPVVGYEGRYEVSDLGRARSLTRTYIRRDGRRQTNAGRVLRPGLASNGYWTVALGRGNTRTVHSLVAEAFLGPCPTGHEVRHKNGTRTDSRAANLEYGTRSDNIRDAVEHGTYSSAKRRRHYEKLAVIGRRARGCRA